MKSSTAFFLSFLLTFLLYSDISISNHNPDNNTVQLAILLDTSNSMDGLIDQAKTQLWKIVNEMSRSKRNGISIGLNVALYEYGNDNLSSEKGYVRMVVPLTNDLDKISEELFRLKTNGGNEYCGTVISRAIKNLKWMKNNDDLKVIFIAGNEPFTQGDIDYKKACRDAISKGIIVNTIYCGEYDEGVQTNWKDGADLALWRCTSTMPRMSWSSSSARSGRNPRLFTRWALRRAMPRSSSVCSGAGARRSSMCVSMSRTAIRRASSSSSRSSARPIPGSRSWRATSSRAK